MKQEDPALANNPLNITQDPEFQALNPGINPIIISGATSEAASELMALSSDSDVMEALTTYINDDPTARAWLNGTPDQWGMVVNPAYKGIKLPVDQWPLLSTFEPTTYYQTDDNDCLLNDPVPYQPLVAAPLANLADISESMQYNEPNSTTQCDQPIAGSPVGEKLTTDGQQTVGNRFMIGITPLADDQRYLLQSAALQTTADTFVAPKRPLARGGHEPARTRSDPRAPGRFLTRTSSSPPAPRPIRAPWSSTPPSRPAGCRRPMRRTTPRSCSSRPRPVRPRAWGSASSLRATSR